MRFLKKRAPVRTSRPADLGAHPRIDGLESRVVPSTTSGNLWPNPQTITERWRREDLHDKVNRAACVGVFLTDRNRPDHGRTRR
jgi:hypothetical protein